MTFADNSHAADGEPLRSALMLGALGVVFGDIGTSPIYAFREALGSAGADQSEATILGVLSLMLWAVVAVVAVKYVVIVMRAANQGEGGTMALLSLALPSAGRWREALLVIGLGGASLFFGDAMITPAISVLSAVEGLSVVTPRVEPYVVPIACVVLFMLFAVQSRGSGRMGRLFGPIMVLWFATLAVAGVVQIAKHPAVLAAVNPWYAIHYVTHASGSGAFIVLGSVFLALTGGEALYADMGHFGRRAIRVDWFVVVMPALALNYLGQGSLVLHDPTAASKPFFLLFSDKVLIPLVVLTTAATVIASQAVLSGAFALVQQAIQLGVLPRMAITRTSDESAGQVYVAQVNWVVAVAVFGLVIGFRTSDALANAYGIAVAGDMLVTTLLVTTVALNVWKWPRAAVLPLMGAFLALDIVFVSANVHKIPAGGWFPLSVGAVLLTMMLCWRKGRRIALARREDQAVTLRDFVAGLSTLPAGRRVPGTAIYITQMDDLVPRALALNLQHNGVVHERVVFLKVTTERAPRVAEASRLHVTDIADGFSRVEIVFGFAEKPDVPAALKTHRDEIGFEPSTASYFLGRETPVPALNPDLPRWQEAIYAFLTRNATRTPDYFLIPYGQVVELGTRVEL